MSESATNPSTRSTDWQNNGFFSSQPRAAAQQDTSSEGKPSAGASFQHQTHAFAHESETTSRARTRAFEQPSFGCKTSIAQHRLDEQTARKRTEDVNRSRQSSEFATGRKQLTKFLGDNLSSFGPDRKYVADEHDDDQKQPKRESLCEKFFRMARRRYFISLFCLSAFVCACLLASVVISRSISTPDLDSDTSRDGRQQASLLAGQPVEQFEVRSFELVDLIEHDRTFAYTKWQVKVRVPKSAPTYQQHSLAPNAIEADGKRDLPEANKGAAKSELIAAGSEQDETQEDQYQLIGTRAFVADHTDAMAAGAASSDVDKSQAASALEAAFASELDDPIQVAAAEMQLDSRSVNSTLTDCFMVDIDKRYGQKVALETRHRKVANTRRVNFKRMLETITACRLLTWNALTSQMNSTTLLAPTKAAPGTATDATLMPANEQSKLLTKREQPLVERRSARAQVPMSDKDALNEVIKPVNKNPEQRQGLTEEPFGAFVGALISWSRLPNATVGRAPINDARRSAAAIEGSSMEAEEAQQMPVAPALAENSRAADEEAKRASYLNAGMSMISGIVPNTLWCGLGDRAANYSELGSEFMVDACCRAHDHCPIRLKPFTADYGLINWSMSTRSHCDCDLDFNECLTSVNSTLSNVIKTLYFRFIGLQCIDLGAAAQRPPPPLPEGPEVRV